MKYDNNDKRIRGRALQARRLRVWSAFPYCAACGILTTYPEGFNLDHTVALVNGGPDTDDNTQVLCIPCHDKKSMQDMGYAERVTIGPDGWPV